MKFLKDESRLVHSGIKFMPEPERCCPPFLPLDYRSRDWRKPREYLKKLCMSKLVSATLETMHMQPLYKGSKYHGIGTDEYLFLNGLCLPSGSDMTNSQQDEVIDRILDMLC